MKSKHILWVVLIILITISLGFGTIFISDGPTPPQTDSIKVDSIESYSTKELAIGSLTVLKPIQHENLQVFAIVSKAEISNRKYVTLNEAMKNNLVKLNETGQVNSLSIDNLSNEYIFIQAGDIVKGGKQDRTLQTDLILPPHSVDVALNSFCVEQGRWTNRGNEDVSQFSYSEKNLSSRDLKFAAKKEGNQSMVWGKVKEQQDKLNENMVKKYDDANIRVENATSTSSYQLTLENDKLVEFQEEYRKTLEAILKTENIVGLAYAVNGEVYGLDAFNNYELFNDLSDKLLDAFIIEAISQKNDDEFKPVSINEISELLVIEEKMKATTTNTRKLNEITEYAFEEYGLTNKYLTSDLSLKKWLHLNFIIASNETLQLDYNPRR
jgi:hypothetical protein